MELLTPKEAASVLKISPATMSRCVRRGAPVHRWGSTGRHYRINVSEFTAWMEAQGPRNPEHAEIARSVMDARKLAEIRRAHVASLGR